MRFSRGRRRRSRERTKEGAKTLGEEALVAEGVGAVLVEDRADGERVGEELGDVSSCALRVDRGEASSVEEDVPVAHRDRFFVRLLA